MNGISSYLLTVLSVSIICALLKRLFEKQDGASGVIRLLTGILVMITIIRPVISISLNDFQWEIEEYNNAASSAVEYGEAQAKASMETFIIEQTEAYILNEAKKFQLDLHVDVRLNGDDPPLPAQVTVTGDVSPYAKAYLTHYMTKELGISKEEQMWIG